jgi:hypothetical protein
MRILIGLAIMLALVLGLVGCAKPPKQIPPPKKPISLKGQISYGPATAKVHIQAFYPFNEKHLKIINFLKELADQYPGKVDVNAWDFNTTDGAAVTKELMGKICGGIIINGKSDFKAPVEGKVSEISTMDGEWLTWTKPEVAAAVAQVVGQMYPGTKAAPLPKSAQEK